MSESGNGDKPPDPGHPGRDAGSAGTGHGHGSPGLPPNILIGVSSGVIATVIMWQVHEIPWLRTLVTAAVMAAGIALLGWLAARDSVRSALAKAFPKVPRGTVAAVGWFSSGAAAMTLVLGAGVGLHRLQERAGSCGQPLELRVATGPATLRPVSHAAAEFESASQDHGCSEYSVSVIAGPGPLQLHTAFGEQWRRGQAAGGRAPDNDVLFGPQPDIWIPSSTAEFEYVEDIGRSGIEAGGAGGPAEGRPEFHEQPSSLGRSPMTLALFGATHRRVADLRATTVATDIGDLLGRVSAGHVKLRAIARPVPETSAAALAVTPALYTRTPGADNRADERFAEPDDLAAPDAVSLLCQFREKAAAGEEPPQDIAVAVPEQLLSDYDLGLPLGDGQCEGVDPDAAPYAAWRLYPHYSADLPMFDHPFVQVTWPGQETDERTDAVHAFRDWLDRHPLTAEGFRDGLGRIPAAGRDDRAHYYLSRLKAQLGPHVLPDEISSQGPGAMQSALNEVSRARPKVSLSLMLDVSGSMGSTAKGHGDTRLARGASFLRSLVAQLQDSDTAGLQVSSAEQAPEDQRPSGGARGAMMSPEQKNGILRRLQDATSAGSDRSLTKTLKGADLGPGLTNLVLVTDGQVPSTNSDLREGRLSREFFGEHPDVRLTIVLAGPSDCGTAPVGDLVDAFQKDGDADCLELKADPGEQERQAARLMLRLRLGGKG